MMEYQARSQKEFFMFTNKCIKCGKEFETKNPKRVICPECLYPDKASLSSNVSENAPQASGAESYPKNYSFGNDNAPQRYNNRRPSYNRDDRGGYTRRPSYNNDGGQRQDNRRRFPQQGRPQQGGFNRGGFNKRRPPQKPKTLLVNREQLAQIEELYKKMLPLPNPDAHEVIGEKIGLEAKKVFFGINLVRQKLMLPKISMPKRKLALTPDQLMAIKNLYEPLLPLPPIGCHKIIAAQLKMDEWRVHVGIGLVRKQMGLDRWNQEREDAPEEYRKQAE